MQSAPVTSETGALFLDLKDVVHINLDSKKRYINLHTPTASYQLVRSIMDFAAATSGSMIQRVEQNTIVNFEYITSFDSENNILHFVESGNDNIDWCYVSRDNRPKVLKYLKGK